jgi:hypothetical protein
LVTAFVLATDKGERIEGRQAASEHGV